MGAIQQGTEGVPEMRSAQMQQNVRALAALGYESESRIRSLAGPALFETIENAARLSYLPAILDVELTEAVGTVVGLAAARQWSCDAFIHALSSPLYRPMMDAAIRLFGLTPRAMYRWVPKGWSSMYRNCGEVVEVHPSARRSILTWSGVPQIMYSSDAYLAGIAGALDAGVQVCRVEGVVALRRVDPDQVVLDCQWAGRESDSV